MIDGVELAAHRLLALLLPRHDEGTADVAVLVETFPVLDAQQLRHLQRAGAAGVGHRNDHVDVVVGMDAAQLLGQPLTHAHARPIHRYVVDDRIGPREIHVLENTRGVAHGADALLRMQAPEFVDEHRLARGHVAHQVETQYIQRDIFGGQHVLVALAGAAQAQHQRTYAVGVAKTQHTIADQHGDHGVAAAAAPVDRAGGREDVGRRHARRTHALQLGSEHVQQHFGIGLGIQVAAILAHQHFGQLGGVRQVAVVRQADAVGCIHIKGLGLGGTVAARGGIAHVADADRAPQFQHVVLLEHVAHQAGALAHAQFALVRRHDAGGILAAVLQFSQCVVDALIDRAGAHNADDATHGSDLVPYRQDYRSYDGVQTVCLGYRAPAPTGDTSPRRSALRSGTAWRPHPAAPRRAVRQTARPACDRDR